MEKISTTGNYQDKVRIVEDMALSEAKKRTLVSGFMKRFQVWLSF
jgi:hypothetical protein